MGSNHVIEKGDIIQATGLAFYGTVTGEGKVGKTPCWKIRTPGGAKSVIPKRQAKLLWKADDPGFEYLGGQQNG